MSVRRSAASQPHRSPGTGVVWRLWSEPPDLVQTGSGTQMDLPALCPEQSGAKPAAPSSVGTQSYRSSLDVYEDPVRRLGQLASRLVGRVERRSGLLGHRRLGEPGVALDAVERVAEDDLRDRAPDVGERASRSVG